MADLSDVQNALVSAVTQVLYPNGTGQPSALVVNGNPVPVRIFPGWPIAAGLDADLAAGIVNVSVFAPDGMERNTTRGPVDFQQLTAPVHTLTATVDPTGTEVTIGGTVSVPQNVALLLNGGAVVYPVQAGDNPDSIAAALAALVGDTLTPATAAANVVTIPGAIHLVARIGGAGTSIAEVGRQERLFQITFWCPASSPPPAVRDAAVKLVDPVLRRASRLPLADGTAGQLVYVRTSQDDARQKVGCWRRDLFYRCEYGTTVTETDTEIIVVATTLTGGVDPTAPVIATLFQ